MNLFLVLGIVFSLALLIKAVVRSLNIPEVTGYVLLGVLLGGSVIKLLDVDQMEALAPLSTVALGIISFMIGVELKLDVIKRLGRPIFFIVVFECLLAFSLVLGTYLAFFPAHFNEALLLGAVAAATAPAATVAVIRQYKAKGTLTSTILAVVGIDDAMALIIYVFASSFVKSSLAGTHIAVMSILLQSVLSISLSIFLGAAAGFLFVLLLGKHRENDLLILSMAAFIIGLIGLSETFNVSELLSIMTFGAVVTNRSPILGKKAEAILDAYNPIFLACFFILGGAHLDIRLIRDIGFTGLLYFCARTLGKIGGGSLGAFIGKASPAIRKYVGFALIPQVGVALALALSINKEFNIPKFGNTGHEMSVMIINVLLFTTIITEVIGPLLTRTVLRKAGDIDRGEG